MPTKYRAQRARSPIPAPSAAAPVYPGARSRIEHWARGAGADRAGEAIVGLGLLAAARSRIVGGGGVDAAVGGRRGGRPDALAAVRDLISADVAANAGRPVGHWSLGHDGSPSSLEASLSSVGPVDAADLARWVRANTWLAAIEIDPDGLDLDALDWLATVTAEQMTTSSFVAMPQMGTSPEFGWPIRLGFLGDPASHRVADALAAHIRTDREWLGHLLDIRFPSGPEEALDILLVPTTLDDAIEQLAARPHGLDAAALVVLGGAGGARSMTAEGLRGALFESLDPSAVAVTDVAEGQVVPWFVELVRALSHNRTLDEAVPGRGLVIAEPASLDRMRVRRAAMAAIESLPTANGGGVVALAPEEAVSFGLPPVASGAGGGGGGGGGGLEMAPEENVSLGLPTVVPRDVLLDRVAADDAFFQESTGATATSRIVRRSPPRPPAQVTPRWIVGRIGHRAPDGTETFVTGGLRRRTRYFLDFMIGAGREGWVTATGAFPDVVPRDGKRHRLRVVFQSEGQRRPLVNYVELPPQGDSTQCRFPFRTSTGARYRGRIIVQFRNRVVQTAIVNAGLSDKPDRRGSAALRIDIEAVIRPGLADLSRRRAFDMAVVHNHDESGKPVATGLSGDWARKFQMSRVEILSSSIKRLLDRVAAAPDTYKELTDQPTTELMYALALQGVELQRTLFPDGPPARIDPEGRTPRVQVVAADPNAFFPLEFVYDFPPPSAPTLCKNAATALADGRCDPARYHRKNADGSIKVVCPIGFWALNRVIERHLTPDEWLPDLLGYDFALRSEPVTGRDRLGGLSSAVFACSDRVTAADATTVDGVLATATGKPSTRVTTWDDWVKTVKKEAPDVLVLLAHTARDAVADQTALMIETDQQRLAAVLGEAYVRLAKPKAVRDKPGPLVFLLGCDTARPWLEYQSFVVRFRNNRAALVVGTVATVPAAHAANVARQLLQELAGRLGPGNTAGAGRPEAFGDLLLAARRSIVASGEVVGMCLTSYGDADWKFG